jgi:hypothetical protein
MTLPNLTHTDVAAIEEFARAVQNGSTHANPPRQLSVGGIVVNVRGVTCGRQEDECADDKLHAKYSLVCKEIQIQCMGYERSKTSAELDRIVCVVGHEALHAIQHQHRYLSNEQIADAIAANKRANTEGAKAEDYAAYITCDMELPAHAVMIALELRKRNPSDFEKAARGTAIFGYFSKQLTGAREAEQVLQRLVAAAHELHTHLQP